MKEITVVAAALCKDDKIFIAQRPENKLPPLVWEFPGGKPEKGESLQQALKRELKEELGVETRIGDFIAKNVHNYDFAKVTINLFKAQLQNEDDVICDNEHVATAWVRCSELDNYEFAKADVPLISWVKKMI